MPRVWDVRDLETWDARIRDKVEEVGLDCFPQEFELCDHNQMLGYMAYHGMPAHYPHWSYGKSFEKLKTLYDYGVSGLPYEMVINSNPSLAYLMRDNSLLLQVLTIAHVYGHNDFFKNNFTFQSTRPEFTISTFKAHATRIRRYVEDPSIGIDSMEHLLDAAHALSLQCRRNLAIRKLSPDEARQRVIDAAQPVHHPFERLHRREPTAEPDLHRVPLIPDEDLLLFVRDHNPFLSEWQKDVLTIVHEEAQYFIPQIETKIMNEGWATYWHKRILDSLALPQDLYLELLVRHSQVVRPHPGGLNPYHLGLRVWEDIWRRYSEPTAEEAKTLPPGDAKQKLFEARSVDRDVSFLRRHLTESLMRDLHLFEFEERSGDMVVREVSNEEGWQQVRETLLKSIGMATTPVIKVVDADFGRNHTLHLIHDHDGRDLKLEAAERTLSYVHRLWQREVVLESVLDGKKALLSFGERGFASRPGR